MNRLKVKGVEEFDAALKSVLDWLPGGRKELNERFDEIAEKETIVNHAEALAVKAAQGYADKAMDKLEGIG